MISHLIFFQAIPSKAIHVKGWLSSFCAIFVEVLEEIAIFCVNIVARTDHRSKIYLAGESNV